MFWKGFIVAHVTFRLFLAVSRKSGLQLIPTAGWAGVDERALRLRGEQAAPHLLRIPLIPSKGHGQISQL